MSQELVAPSSNTGEELSLNDIEKALKDDDTPETDNLLAEESAPKKETKEKVDDGEEPELELEDEDEQPNETDLALQTPPRRKEILAKYPTLFKDFPYLQSAFYREQQFTEMFPTIEDAKEVKERADEFSKFEQSLLSGNTESLLKSIKSADEKAFNKIVDDYLPTLYKADQAAYWHVAGNFYKNTIQSMVAEAGRLGNDDLKNAALILNQFVFGKSEFQQPTRLTKENEQQDGETERLSKEREAFMRERFETTRDDLSARVDNILKSTINQNIDPKGAMTDYVRRTASREVFERLEQAIASDARFKATLDKLWEVAFKQNFSKASMDAIRSSYLGKAKNLLPALIQKSRNDALRGLGKRVQESRKTEEKEEKETRTYQTRARTNDGDRKIPHTVKTLDFLNQD